MISEKEKRNESLLEEHGLRKTAFRKEVLGIFLANQGNAIHNAVIEDSLGDFDRITLYRTLKSFENKGLIHIAMDNAGQAKYALCSHHCDEDEHHDMHAHFHCDKCGKTECLDDVPQRLDSLVPNGYNVKDIQVTFSGLCSVCN